MTDVGSFFRHLAGCTFEIRFIRASDGSLLAGSPGFFPSSDDTAPSCSSSPGGMRRAAGNDGTRGRGEGACAGGVPFREGIGSAANILVLSTWRRTGFKWSTGGCGNFHESESIVSERMADVKMGARGLNLGQNFCSLPCWQRREPKRIWGEEIRKRRS